MEAPEYQWQSAVTAAVTDIDAKNSWSRLMLADDAVFNRLFELEATNGTDGERLALENAMQDLRLLRESRYHFRI